MTFKDGKMLEEMIARISSIIDSETDSLRTSEREAVVLLKGIRQSLINKLRKEVE